MNSAHSTLRPAWKIKPVIFVSLPCAQWGVHDSWFLHARSKDSDQTGLMPSLIRAFAVRTDYIVGFIMRSFKMLLKLNL